MIYALIVEVKWANNNIRHLVYAILLDIGAIVYSVWEIFELLEPKERYFKNSH